jgi:hypothetical protein
MKAAAEAWGSNVTAFKNGFARLTQDPAAVQAALAQPGVILKRPFGTGGAFKSDPDPIPQPKVSPAQKAKAAKAAQDKKNREKVEQRDRAAAEKRAKEQAQEELAQIEREEAELRERRQKLQKKFQLRSV